MSLLSSISLCYHSLSMEELSLGNVARSHDMHSRAIFIASRVAKDLNVLCGNGSTVLFDIFGSDPAIVNQHIASPPTIQRSADVEKVQRCCIRVTNVLMIYFFSVQVISHSHPMSDFMVGVLAERIFKTFQFANSVTSQAFPPLHLILFSQ